MNENNNALENTWIDLDDAPELDETFFDQATPKINDEAVSVSEVKVAFTQRLGRPKSDNPKKAISIRLSPEVVEYFKSTGKGWQTRMDEALQEYVAAQQQ